MGWLENDLENPKNYSENLRWSVTALIATMTLCVALASPAYSETVGTVLAEFECSQEVIILDLSLMVLGYAIGPLLWAPISESVGGRNIFLLSYTGYTILLDAAVRKMFGPSLFSAFSQVSLDPAPFVFPEVRSRIYSDRSFAASGLVSFVLHPSLDQLLVLSSVVSLVMQLAGVG